jgi:hypothetical protein
MLTLSASGGERLLGIGRVHVVELAITVGLGVVQRLSVLTRQHAPESATLDIRHMPNETKQRQRGGLGRAQLELVIAEISALHEESRSVIVEPGIEHGPLVGDEGDLGTLCLGCDHGSILQHSKYMRHLSAHLLEETRPKEPA